MNLHKDKPYKRLWRLPSLWNILKTVIWKTLFSKSQLLHLKSWEEGGRQGCLFFSLRSLTSWCWGFDSLANWFIWSFILILYEDLYELIYLHFSSYFSAVKSLDDIPTGLYLSEDKTLIVVAGSFNAVKSGLQ